MLDELQRGCSQKRRTGLAFPFRYFDRQWQISGRIAWAVADCLDNPNTGGYVSDLGASPNLLPG